MKAEVLTIGDEVLRGEIVDSNKSALSARLLRLDIETHFQTSVRDDPADMQDALLRASARADVVLVSGGLGPTRDDLTIEVLARTFERKLVLHEPSLAAIRSFFERVGREMAPVNAKQALMPEGAEVLPNPIGTAPGCMLLVGEVPIFCMPGVPRELERMMDEQVLPRIEARHPGRAIVRARILRTFGMGESDLEEALADIARGGDVTLGFRTAFPDNLLRPITRAATAAEADARLETICAAIRERLGPLVYGEGDDTLEARGRSPASGAGRYAGGGGVVHRRHARRAHHGRGGLLRLLSRRRRGLRERRQAVVARCSGGAPRAARCGVRTGGEGHGGGCAGALRGVSRRLHHRDLRARVGAARRSPSARSASRSPTLRARTPSSSSSRSIGRGIAGSRRRSRSTGCGAGFSANRCWRRP